MIDLKILKSKKILYVESDNVLFENILSLFKLYFDDITSAKNGLDTMNLLKTNSFDIVILDIDLSDIKGLEIASKIREKNDKTLIIVTSIHKKFEDLRKSIHLGVSDYLLKPFDFNELKRTIERCAQIFEKTNEKKELLAFDLYYDWLNKKIQTNCEIINLTKKEIVFIELLLVNKGRNLGYSEINFKLNTKKVLTSATQNGIKNIVFRLKKKLKRNIFENIAGFGYCLKEI